MGRIQELYRAGLLERLREFRDRLGESGEDNDAMLVEDAITEIRIFSPRDPAEQAKEEFKAEKHREEVDRIKDRLRAGKWWHGLIPYTVTIAKRK